MDPKDERFNAKVTVLVENVRSHVRDEEHDLFPEVRAQLGRKALVELGEQLQKAKRRAPLARTAVARRATRKYHRRCGGWRCRSG